MNVDELRADAPLLAMRQTMAWGSLVTGAVVLGALLVVTTSARPPMVEIGAVVTVAWGLASWLLQRRSARGRWDAAPTATSGPVGDHRSATRHVVRRLAVAVPLVAIVLVVISRVNGPVVAGLAWGVPLGGGLSIVLRCRDLASWQRAVGAELFTRQGARVFAANVPLEPPRLVRVPVPGAPRRTPAS